MLRNYITTAYRILFRNKIFSLINIFGLSIALTSVLVIFLFISNELSFDKHNSKFENVYRIVTKTIGDDKDEFEEAVPVPLSSALKSELTGHNDITQIYFDGEQLIRIGEDKFLQSGFLFADTNFIKVFDVEFISGNPVELKNPNMIFLTEELAIRYFSSVKNAINKEIVIMDSVSLNVAGVIKNPPKNTHLPFKAILSWNSLTKDFFSFNYDRWGVTLTGFGTYLTVKEGVSEEQINNQIMEIVSKHNPEEKETTNEIYFLQDLSKIHFDDRFASFSGSYVTSKRFVWIFISVGLFILMIAFINFTNLSIVQAIKRAKEVGIRKVVGADRYKLIKQFLGETFLLVIISEIIALILTEVVLSKINLILGNNIELELYGDISIILFLLIVLVSITFLSGIYPAMVLSRYNPIRALRYNMKLGRIKTFSLYNLLVIFQFFISQVLIVSAIIISLQMDFFKNKDLGFNKENVILVNLPQNQSKRANVLVDLLIQNPAIKNISRGLNAPLSNDNIYALFQVTGNSETNYHANIKMVDSSYCKLYDLKLIAGKWYTNHNTNDTTYNIVINRSLMNKLNIKDPVDAIGESLIRFTKHPAMIIGVVEDFHAFSLQHDIPSVIFLSVEKFYSQIHIKTTGTSYSDLHSFIEKSWNEVFPEYIYTYDILEENIDEQYESEQRVFDVIKIFTIVAILIACLGLYGLVSFMLVQRTKEIGIRKAMGASISSLITLVSKQFIKLVLISCVFAWPVAYYLMDNWLKNYAYKIDLSIWVFIISGIILLIITFLTILYQSLKVARTNPVDSLKYE